MTGGQAVLALPAAVHPTARTCDNVHGRVQIGTEGDAPQHARNMMVHFGVLDAPQHPCAFRVPLRDLRAIREHVPSAMRPIGFVELYAQSKHTLFFHTCPYDEHRRASSDWDGHRLVDALVPFADILASQQVPSLYLINPSAEERAKHQTPRFADDAIEAVLARRSPLPPAPTHSDTLAAWAKSTHMSVLTQLSHVMRGARDSGHAFLSHPIVRRAAPQLSASQAGPYMVSAQTDSTAPTSSDPLSVEFDAARVYLTKWARQVAQEGELNRMAEQAMLRDPDRDAESLLGTSYLPTLPQTDKLVPLTHAACTELLESGAPAHDIAQRVFRHGLTPEARRLLWPYMLGALPLNSRREGRDAQDAEMQRTYDMWKQRWFGQPRPRAAEHEASQHRIWIDCLRADTKHDFFQHEPPLDIEAHVVASGWLRSRPQGAEHAQVNKHLFLLSEILWTFDVYAEHANDTKLPAIEGYVQGMSDLCSVCYVACSGDEARTFWTFVALMRMWGSHYVADQSGMRHELLLLQRLVAELCPRLYAYLQRIDGLNLFFCFRWLLVCFKREFVLDDVLRIWDAMWSARWSEAEHRGWPLCTHMHLFVALAILESHERLILRYLASFDEVLMFIHSLAFQMDATSVLRRAEALVYRLRSRVGQEPPVDEELRSMVLC